MLKEVNITIGILSIEWLELNKNCLKTSTNQTYKYLIDKYISNDIISTIPIVNLSTKDVIKFSDRLISKKLAPRTINNILLVVSYIIKFSNQKYETPCVKMCFVKEIKKEMRVLSKNEQKKLEEHLYSDMDIYKFATLLALYTGLRIGEICALKWEDITDSVISVNKTMLRLKSRSGKTSVTICAPKTNSSFRSVPYPNFLESVIDRFRKETDSFVLSTDKLDYIEPRLLQIKFNKLVDNCSLQDVTFHTLRHTFATRCVECGFDAKTLSEILGHSDVKTTLNRYVHSSIELKKENMNKLEAFRI